MEARKILSYEAVISKGDDGYTVVFPQFPGAFAEGDTRKEALESAHEALVLAIADRYECCDRLPPEDHVVEVATISVEMTQSIADEVEYMTMQQAAEFLDVGLSRVSQLIKAGKLADRYFGKVHMVSIESVERYRNNPRKAGRPRNQILISFDQPVKMGSMGKLNGTDWKIYENGWLDRSCLHSFESAGGYDPSLITANLPKGEFAYEGMCCLETDCRKCVIVVREDGKFFVTVDGQHDTLFSLFGGENIIDALVFYPQSQVSCEVQ